MLTPPQLSDGDGVEFRHLHTGFLTDMQRQLTQHSLGDLSDGLGFNCIPHSEPDSAGGAG